MKTMKTSELTGKALDWAVAKAEGWEGWDWDSGESPSFNEQYGAYSFLLLEQFCPSSHWAIAGPIIEREHIGIRHHEMDETWSAGTYAFGGFGHSPLIAAMRCYAASKLGDVVEVPVELQ